MALSNRELRLLLLLVLAAVIISTGVHGGFSIAGQGSDEFNASVLALNCLLLAGTVAFVIIHGERLWAFSPLLIVEVVLVVCTAVQTAYPPNAALGAIELTFASLTLCINQCRLDPQSLCWRNRLLDTVQDHIEQGEKSASKRLRPVERKG